MSEKKSRRRFLADLLFLGGGLTAASLVTGAVLRRSSPTVESELTSAETAEKAPAPEPRKATLGFDPNDDDGILKCESKQIDEPLILRAREKTYRAVPPDYAYGGIMLPRIE